MPAFSVATKILLGCKGSKCTLSDHSIDRGTGHRHTIASGSYSDDLRRPRESQMRLDIVIEFTVRGNGSFPDGVLTPLDIERRCTPGMIPVFLAAVITLYFPLDGRPMASQFTGDLTIIFLLSQKLS